jgi:hypothetical protein
MASGPPPHPTPRRCFSLRQDLDIKTRVIGEAMDLVRLSIKKRKVLQDSQGAATRQRLYGGSASSASGSALAAGGSARDKEGAQPSRPHLLRASSAGSSDLGVAPGSPSARGLHKGGGDAATVAGRLLEFRDGGGASSGSSAASPFEGDTGLPSRYDPGAGIDRGMQLHEAATARDYKLIYPLPDPACVAEAVFVDNCKLEARMAATVARQHPPKAGSALPGAASSDSKPLLSSADALSALAPPLDSCGDESDDGFGIDAVVAGGGAALLPREESVAAVSASPVKLRPASAHELQLRGRMLKEQLRKADDVASDDDESGEDSALLTATAANFSGPQSRLSARLTASSSNSGIGTSSPASGAPLLAQRPRSARPRSAAVMRSVSSGAGASNGPSSVEVVIDAAGGRSVQAVQAAELASVVAAALRKDATTSAAGSTGVPAPYAVPWDSSRSALELRLKQYRAYALVAAELYKLELASTSGRHMSEQQLAGSAAIIAAAAHSVSDGAAKSKAPDGTSSSKASPAAGGTSGKAGIGETLSRSSASKDPTAEVSLAHFIRTVRALAGPAGKPREDSDSHVGPSLMRSFSAGSESAPLRDSAAGVPTAPLIPRVAVLAQAKQAAEATRRLYAEEERLGGTPLSRLRMPVPCSPLVAPSTSEPVDLPRDGGLPAAAQSIGSSVGSLGVFELMRSTSASSTATTPTSSGRRFDPPLSVRGPPPTATHSASFRLPQNSSVAASPRTIVVEPVIPPLPNNRSGGGSHVLHAVGPPVRAALSSKPPITRGVGGFMIAPPPQSTVMVTFQGTPISQYTNNLPLALATAAAIVSVNPSSEQPQSSFSSTPSDIGSVGADGPGNKYTTHGGSSGATSVSSSDVGATSTAFSRPDIPRLASKSSNEHRETSSFLNTGALAAHLQRQQIVSGTGGLHSVLARSTVEKRDSATPDWRPASITSFSSILPQTSFKSPRANDTSSGAYRGDGLLIHSLHRSPVGSMPVGGSSSTSTPVATSNSGAHNISASLPPLPLALQESRASPGAPPHSPMRARGSSSGRSSSWSLGGSGRVSAGKNAVGVSSPLHATAVASDVFR